jgi:Flp pilus assembly protein TadD
VLTWEQVAPPPGLSPALAATTLQEWPAAPFAVAHAQIARQQLEEGRAAEALAHLDQALEISPGYVEARFHRGVILASYGDTDLALHDWLVVRKGGKPAETQYLGNCIEKAYAAKGDERSRQLGKLLRG